MSSYNFVRIGKFKKLLLNLSSSTTCHYNQKMSLSKCCDLNLGKAQRVHVVSRIEGLTSALKHLRDEARNPLNIVEVPVSAKSNCLKFASEVGVLDAEVVIIDPILLATYRKSMPNLKWAHVTWAGVEPLFQIMDKKPSFIVTRHADETFSEQMAEYVMFHVLLLEKNFKDLYLAQMDKSWSRMEESVKASRNRHLQDLTFGILGVGNMGKAIAKYFKPHGTKLIGLCRRPRQAHEFGLFDKIETSVIKVLETSDYIINTLPHTPYTSDLLNEEALASCTKMPVFINVGRASVIQENTLCKAIKQRWLSHAVLDVFEEEPLPVHSLLWNLKDQVTITPHCAAISHPHLIAKDFMSALKYYQEKKPMENIINWDEGY